MKSFKALPARQDNSVPYQSDNNYAEAQADHSPILNVKASTSLKISDFHKDVQSIYKEIYVRC